MEMDTANQEAGPSQASEPTPVTPALIKSFNDYPWVKDRQFLVSSPPTRPIAAAHHQI